MAASSLLHLRSAKIESNSYVLACIRKSFRRTIASIPGNKEAAISQESVKVLSKTYPRDEQTNVTPTILSKVGRNLHHVKDHPLKILKDQIHEFVYDSYRKWGNGPMFTTIDNLSPVVTVAQNFDSLLVPKDHISRSRNDNYYINKEFLLRAHTSAHQLDLIRSGLDAFLVTGDVYRRDEIDSCHYPVFHQMEGVRLFTQHELFSSYKDPLEIFDKTGSRTEDKQAIHTLEAVKLVEFNLKSTLTGIVQKLCGEGVEMQWVDTYFPFTHPSWELEVKFGGEWLEVLGCGVMEQQLLENSGAGHQIGWAFGIGLERLAMRLFDIPDIRLFWSTDERFLGQFKDGQIEAFKPFSKYPPTYKDIAFWISEGFSPNDLFELVRNIAGDLIEQVEQIDSFVHPKTNQESQCYRITYRAMDRTLEAQEVNAIQDIVREEVEKRLKVKLR
ncbi:phenylalanine--tRNA ligase, mitochondrial [Nematostella vectensis]|uniref:phenylalanine--tRNA ligase, mitochondrial n=1 Tax=Nematostella vectensis TaxID=45351 RepID=UPI001390163C|nr:phenylalanine--tRNA ligase, mitochondrial [Nematostella vectensis]